MENKVLHCNSCGSYEIEIKSQTRLGKCKSCGANVILPDLEDHEILHLLDQAYIQRNNYAFDEAISTYNHVLSKSPNEICALEGLILCKYGIVYVKDPKTKKNIPTCHRYCPDSIYKDQEFIKYFYLCPTEEEKQVFKLMGYQINQLQKKIAEQVKKEKDYDIFISFKAKDENDKSTEDAYIARELYDQLTSEGYEVFMSDVSLKNRINEDFEPIIYNALHTSEVFILVGTSKKNVYSPWVRNEWSRFIDIVKNSDGRLNNDFFIRVFKGMSANDMPRIENRNVQGVDASDLLYKKRISDYIKQLIKPSNSKNEKESAKKAVNYYNAKNTEDLSRNILACNDTKTKIHLVNTFLMPDEKRDLFGLLELAISNIKNHVKKYDGTINALEEELYNAWIVKIEQCNRKIKFSSPDLHEMEYLTELNYEVNEIKEEKNKIQKDKLKKDGPNENILLNSTFLNKFKKFLLFVIGFLFILDIVLFSLGSIYAGIVLIFAIILLLVAFFILNIKTKNIVKIISVIPMFAGVLIIIPSIKLFVDNLWYQHQLQLTINWEEIVLKDYIPNLDKKGKIYINTEKELKMRFYNLANQEYNQFIEDSKTIGYTNLKFSDFGIYEAYNSEEYYFDAVWDSSNKNLDIYIETPIEMSTIDWNNILLKDKIPNIVSSLGFIKKNLDTELEIIVDNIPYDRYARFLGNSKTMGYTIENKEILSKREYNYNAYNSEGIMMILNYNDCIDNLYINIILPEVYGTFSWPTSWISSEIPTPKSTTGKIINNSDSHLRILVAETPFADYQEYVNKCIQKGFRKYSWDDVNCFIGHNYNYDLRVEYLGFNVMEIEIKEQ